MTTNLIGTLKEHTSSVYSVAFNTSNILASGGYGTTIKLWDISRKHFWQKNCIRTLKGHTNSVISVTFNGAGLLASGSADKTIKLWDTSTMNCVRTLEGHTETVCSVAFNPDGMLASGSGDKTINLTRIYTKKFIKTALMTMDRCGLIDDIIDNIMEKLGIIDRKGKITGCVV